MNWNQVILCCCEFVWPLKDMGNLKMDWNLKMDIGKNEAVCILHVCIYMCTSLFIIANNFMIFLIYHWIMFLFIVCRWWLFKWHFCGWIEIYAAQRWREMFRGQGGDLVTTTALIILLDCWMVKRNIAYVSYVFSIPAYGIFTMYGTVQEFWTVKSSSCNSQVRQDDARQVARQVAGWLYFFCHVNPWRCLFRRNPWSASQWCWRRLHFECSTGKACEDVVDVLMDTINHWPTWIHTFHWHHPTSNITKTFCWDLWRLQR